MEILIAALPIIGFLPCGLITALSRLVATIRGVVRTAARCDPVHTCEGRSHA